MRLAKSHPARRDEIVMLNATLMPRVQPVHGWHCACVSCKTHRRPLAPTGKQAS